MRETQDILFSVSGQSLVYRVPQGRPSSATFAVYQAAAGENGTAEFSGTATIDSVNTTLSAAAGPTQSDARSLAVTSAVGIVAGRLYLVSDDSVQEWVEPIKIDSTSLTIRRPLLNDFALGAAFQSTHISADIDDTWAATDANLSELDDPNPDYRMRFAITVAGSEYPAYAFFDLVRTPVEVGVTVHDLDDRWHGFLDSLPERHRPDQGRAFIASATRAVKADLLAYGINIDGIREFSALDELTVRKALLLHAAAGHRPHGWADSQSYVAFADAEYSRFIEKHYALQTYREKATGTTGSAGRGSGAPIWRK